MLPKAQSPWVTLAELDSVSMDGTEQLIELLHERSGSSISKIRNDLSKLIDDSLIERLLITCQGIPNYVIELNLMYICFVQILGAIRWFIQQDLLL